MKEAAKSYDISELGDLARDMFVEKWGHGDPPPAYREAWQRDLDSLHFIQQRQEKK